MSIPSNIEELAHKVRTEIYGRDVREALATSMEATAEVAEWSRQVAQQIIDGEFDEAELSTEIERKLNELEQEYAPELTNIKNEVENARGNESTLGDRLDGVSSQLTQSVQNTAQSDFVKTIEDLTNYPKMFFKKLTNDEYSIFTHNGYGHTSFNITRSVNDDLLKIGECYTGTITKTQYDFDKGQKVGTWTSSGEIHYTTTINDKFIAKVKGSQIRLRLYKMSNGGLWEVKINNDPSLSLNLSCNASTSSQEDIIIADDLDPTKTHSVELIFKGVDPDNPVDTPRGLIFHPNSANSGTIVGFVDFNTNTNNLLVKNSNKEFAFHIEKNGISEWVPDHGTGTAFNSELPRFIIGGLEKDVSQLEVDEIVPCDSVRIEQILNIILPGVSGSIAKIYLTFNFNKRGSVNILGKWETLQSCKINAGYPLMLPANPLRLNEAITSYGNTKINSGDDSNYYFEEEKSENCYSVAMVNANRPNLIAAMSVDYPLKTLRLGESGKVLSESLRFWQRPSTPKLYFTNFKNGVLEEGDTFIWQGRIGVAEINNIYNYIKA